MIKKFVVLASSAQKIDRQHIQLVLTFVAILLMVLGVGAPSDGTGPR